MFSLNAKYRSVTSLPAVFIPQYVGQQCTFGFYASCYSLDWAEIALPNSYAAQGDYVEISDEELAQWECDKTPIWLKNAGTGWSL